MLWGIAALLFVWWFIGFVIVHLGPPVHLFLVLALLAALGGLQSDGGGRFRRS